MSNSPFFEEVHIGAEIPVLEKMPMPRQLVMYAGASGDYNPIHYDRDAAAARGLPGIIVHGQLVSACLMQMLTDWLGSAGSLKKYSVSYAVADKSLDEDKYFDTLPFLKQVWHNQRFVIYKVK